MFCPECGAEFRPGFVECNDCGVSLVDELPELPARTDPDARPVVVATSMSLAEAWVVAGMLSASGHRAWLWDVNILSIYWLLMPALGGVRLVASSKDCEEIEELFEHAIQGDPDETPLELAASHPLRRRRWWARAMTYLLLLPYLLALMVIALIVFSGIPAAAPKQSGTRQTE